MKLFLSFPRKQEHKHHLGACYGLPRWLNWTESANAGDAGNMGSILGLGRSLGGENDNPLQYSCLEIFMDKGSWQATVHGVTKSQTQLKQLSTQHTYPYLLLFQFLFHTGNTEYRVEFPMLYSRSLFIVFYRVYLIFIFNKV